jgi:UDPglucose--hexose-1-phosphate uridylyltransferase
MKYAANTTAISYAIMWIMSLHHQIERLINFALQQKLTEAADIVYIRNQYLELFNLEYQPNIMSVTEQLKYPDEILNTILQILTSSSKPNSDKQNSNSIALKTNKNEASSNLKLDLHYDNSYYTRYLGKNADSIKCRIMNILLGQPSTNIDKFNNIKANLGARNALDYWYQRSIASFYIKMCDVEKNKHWYAETKYGQMEITINLSKPEKDPHEIAKLKLQKSTSNDYPKCLLCIENEGFAGNHTKAARQNHRLLPITLNNQTWYFQFSPYVYYEQHSIVINKKHTNMQINAETFIALFDFVDQFAHYFIGSNADIPIVGGSILTHDHYQAGLHIFPLEKAGNSFSFDLTKYPQIKASVVNWPLTVLRFVGNRSDLQNIAELVLDKWRSYSNPELDIIASTDGIQHNAITPIIRKLGSNSYKLDIILRNNRTSDTYPDGIFHPHQELHHIKKENIGLIEAMGLAILPGRLNEELNQIKQILSNNDIEIVKKLDSQIRVPPHENDNISWNDNWSINLNTVRTDCDNQSKELSGSYDSSLYKHKAWLLGLFTKYGSFKNIDINTMLKEEVGNIFCQVLTDSCVFKENSTGIAGLHDFINSLTLPKKPRS